MHERARYIQGEMGRCVCGVSVHNKYRQVAIPMGGAED